MEIGDLLYLLIGAIAIVAGLLKKSKSKERYEESIPQYEPDDNFEEVFQPVYESNEKNIIKNVETKRLEKKPVYESKFKRMNFDKRFQNRKTITTSLKKRKETELVLEEKRDEEIKTFWNQETFELHKAVIYSEILKRPNFENNFLTK